MSLAPRSSFNQYFVMFLALLAVLVAMTDAQGPINSKSKAPPIVGLYLGLYQSVGSQSTCNLALKDFYDKNYMHCDFPEHTHSFASSSAIQSWGARTCGDKELPPGFSRPDCQGALFCRVTSGLRKCPQEFLQKHIEPHRLKMKCVVPTHYLFFSGAQPDTISECMSESEVKQRLAVAPIAYGQTLQVFLSDGKLYVAKTSSITH